MRENLDHKLLNMCLVHVYFDLSYMTFNNLLNIILVSSMSVERATQLCSAGE